ncbi:hypothetical protein [Streptomyces cellulosae]|uniref:hypothetical protein n=1 Tax=Streptomyces cellulosae TaxID=1968 RepID=UPI000A62B1F5|nr:hypothetical protein [Streptomyces cellulosae]
MDNNTKLSECLSPAFPCQGIARPYLAPLLVGERDEHLVMTDGHRMNAGRTTLKVTVAG